MIDVAYLAYFNKEKNYGIDIVNEFLIYYDMYSAGTEHRLTVLAKNWDKCPSEYEELKNIIKKHNAQLLELPDDGLDFGAYFRASKILKEDNVFFLGSNIHIIKDNWLKYHEDAFKKDNELKLAGPMGSIEKGLSNIYPNPHIRTCAFMVDRRLFSEYADSQLFPRTKEDTWMMEHCPNSITRFIMKKGYKVAVINSKGEVFDIKNCLDSKTYFHPEQKQNTLMEDKWLLKYETGSFEDRIVTERTVWGKNITQLPQNFTEQSSELINVIVPHWNFTEIISSMIFRPMFYGEMSKNIETKAFVCKHNGDIKDRLLKFRELDCYKYTLNNLLDEISAEYVGFCQKESFFDFESKLDSQTQEVLAKDFEEKIKLQDDKKIYNEIKEFDVILSSKLKLQGCKLSQQYQLVFEEEIEDTINKTILDITPDFKEALDETLNSSEIYMPGNFIMKKEILKDYLNWLTKIIKQLDEKMIYSKYQDNIKSLFQTERFLNVWINAHKDLKIKEAALYKIYYDPQAYMVACQKKLSKMGINI